jgi:hypothetical protein
MWTRTLTEYLRQSSQMDMPPKEMTCGSNIKNTMPPKEMTCWRDVARTDEQNSAVSSAKSGLLIGDKAGRTTTATAGAVLVINFQDDERVKTKGPRGAARACLPQ